MEKTSLEKIAVMQASWDGKQIQHCAARLDPTYPWIDCGEDIPSWDWFNNDYRVKPEPREWWIVPKSGQMFDKETVAVCGIEVVHVREVLLRKEVGNE